ncbi:MULTISPECIES: MFS transporter [Photorhabdus]|uniref:MFS transporter n=1 Tax=Photorhabdus TaxID=29487 RepID=UPI0021D4AFEE|nr:MULTISPECIES: MFS transporter [Photorhabdus]MCT8350448.1 MFS transporter [Photorhabdus kayaii]MDB6368456.1 MFS transporter [Photorhabdus bodei]
MQWSVIRSLSLLVLLYPLGIDLYLVSVPNIKLHLLASDIEMNRVFSVYLIGVASSLLLAGKTVDRFGMSLTSVFGSALFIASSISCAITPAQEVELFITSRFLQGCGSGICYIAALSTVRKCSYDSDERVKAYAILNGISCTVPILAPSIGAIIVLLGWKSIFYSMAALGVIVSAASVNMNKNIRPLENLGNKVQSINSFLDPNFIKMVIISSVGLTSVFTYVNISPLVLINKYGLTTKEYALWMGLFAALSVTTSFGLSLLRRWISDRILLNTGLIILGAAGCQLYQFEDILGTYSYMITFSLIGIINSILFTITLNRALEPFKTNAGSASGILHTAQLVIAACYMYISGLFNIVLHDMMVFLLIFGSLLGLICVYTVEQR